ncbi:competence protein [Aquibacillus halophilus]|uniref:Competence protein n=1 Tax=Aquibacillus halophilus TaxID=930132 RepID=A0A6A8DCB9_9BACI|nr:competence protein ComK [Aquibacillus halophilus]MRH43333.1 competence protein [Aquibacillus halophilus]
MNDIFTSYHVNYRTMAIIPATHFDYQTIVLESGKKLFIKQTPLEIIKVACLDGGASYDGRRAAVMYQTSCHRKVPIPINPSKNIFTFPTHSPSQLQCKWIFYNHVKIIKPYYSSKSLIPQSIITFKDGQQIIVDESYYILEKQMQRTAICILQFASIEKPLMTV